MYIYYAIYTQYLFARFISFLLYFFACFVNKSEQKKKLKKKIEKKNQTDSQLRNIIWLEWQLISPYTESSV